MLTLKLTFVVGLTLLSSVFFFLSLDSIYPMLDAETVKNNINRRFDALYYKTEDGEAKPYVCLVCDEFLKPEEVKILPLEKLAQAQTILTPAVWNAVSPEVAACYKFRGNICESDRELFLDG